MLSTRTRGEDPSRTALPSSEQAGVRVAMVGDCNAAFATHGFWWTNRATGLTRNSTNATRRAGNGGKNEGSGVTLRSRKTVRKEFTPVFGTGVVFYTDGPEVGCSCRY